MAVYQLDDELWFPDPHLGEDDGFVAIGGDLSVERLLLAYCHGFFPWFAYRYSAEPQWYCPLDRFVIFPKEIHISHSMRQMMRRNEYALTINRDFDGVIRGCASVNGRDGHSCAWLGPDIIAAYTELYRQGYAFSVEVWRGGVGKQLDGAELVGGLYGVSACNAFFGESMFSLVPDASKLALIFLARVIDKLGMSFIDCQFETPHLRSMGGRHITYDEYMDMLTAKYTPD